MSTPIVATPQSTSCRAMCVPSPEAVPETTTSAGSAAVILGASFMSEFLSSRMLLREIAAIDDELAARDEGRLVAREEQADIRDFARRSHPSHRRRIDDARIHLVRLGFN